MLKIDFNFKEPVVANILEGAFYLTVAVFTMYGIFFTVYHAIHSIL